LDKPNREQTVKIKINGENHEFKEESTEKEKKTYTKVIKIDPEYIDHDSVLETAAAQEPAEESFDWIIPESSENEVVEYKIANQKKAKGNPKKKQSSFSAISLKRNGGVFKSILITVAFAILIGISFGVLMLKLFITDGSKTVVNDPVVEDKGSGNTSGEKTNGQTTSAVIAAQTMFVVQGGVFSTKDAAKDGTNQAKAKGAPGQTVEMSNKEYLFLGVADSIETAKQLSSYYKANGVADAFAKQIPIGEKSVSDISEADKSFLEAAMTVFPELSKVTTNTIVTANISEESIKSISALEDKINQKVENEKVKNLQGELTGAIEKAKSKEKKSLEEAQQHLLNFLSAYYSL
jgi:stage II sporulation protein B